MAAWGSLMDKTYDPVVAALLGRMPLPIRPFDPARDAPSDLGLGGMSTEVLETLETPSGDFVNIPSAWFLGDYGPFLVGDPLPFAHDYEMGTARPFPRFDSLDSAVSAAVQRSAMGGASHIALTDSIGQFGSRMPLFGLGLIE